MAKRGRKSKYSPETVEAICTAIATEGGDRSGWQAGDINHDTFYRWIREKPEFAEAIAQARAEYKRNCPKALKKLAQDRCREQLERGQVVYRKQTTKRRLDHYKPDGSLQWYQIETIEKEDEDNLGIQPWAIDRVLPKAPPDVESAIALLEKHGFTISFPEHRLREIIAEAHPETGTGNGGLTAEQADSIRAKILGVEAQPTDSPALPSEVDEG